MKSTPRLCPARARCLGRTLALGAVALAAAILATNVPVRGASADLVISQVYGGGGNSGAPYKNDFVEVFNRGSLAVNLSGKSIQYASATGTGNFSSNAIALLSGTLQPGQYYLVQLAAGTGGGGALPTPDATGTVNLSGTGGKVALVNSTSGLACNGGSVPCSAAQLAQIVDLVGWDGANFFEGSAAPATTNTTADFRANGGCTDTDNNGADFTAAAPAPRNTASAFNVCAGPTPPSGIGLATPASLMAGDPALLTVTVTPGANPTSTGLSVGADLTAIGGVSPQAFYDDATHGDLTAGDNVFSYEMTVPAATSAGARSLPFTVSDAEARSGSGSISLTVAPPPIAIHDIQGSGLTSPYMGLSVTTRGVVTARRYNNGFYIQTPDAQADNDPNTSEGVFVFTSSAPPVAAAVGAYVQVTGTVAEYVPSADPYSPPTTEIDAPTVTVVVPTPAMPAPVTLTAADLPADGTLEQLERYEGMRVLVPFLRTVSPTDGTINEVNATSTSNGVFYAVIDGTPRPFREEGVQVRDPLPAGAPANVPRFDFNPERLRIDSDGQFGASRIDVTSGVLLSNVVGVLDYAYRTWTILPDPGTPVASDNIPPTPVPPPGANEFTVASFNLERFFDTVNDPGIDDVALTPTAFNNRLNKASLAIRTIMLSPDIIGVQEVENLPTLQALADKINADSVAAGQANPGYAAYLSEGNDIGGIDVGFLVRTQRVDVVDVVQEGKNASYTDPNTGLPAMLNDRPPLVLTAEVHGPTGTLPVTVIVNHLRSLSGVDDVVDGRVRAKRLAQAVFLADLIQTRQAANPHERIISVGDYNAYEVNDGYVDVMGVIEGNPAPADQDVLAGGVPVNPVLTDLAALAPAADRYSYSFDGTAQLLDHILVNDPALKRFSGIHVARSNADFPESLRSDPTRPERVSDHDMPVAYFTFPNAPVLQLAGANPMAVECCGTFTDPGATATDTDFGDISPLISVTGTVDTHTVGSYTLTYSISNGYATSTATRTVNVVDTTPPVLSLVGPNPMTVEVGHPFVEPGAVAEDTCAGNLTGAIVSGGTVNTTHVGTYLITYRVTDGYNISSVTRTVRVVDTTPPVMSAIVPTPSVLWPPDNKLEKVTLQYTVTDNSGAAACSVGVVSNERLWDWWDRWDRWGRHETPDWIVVSPTTVFLRAERAEFGKGRVYTITVTCRDGSGNATVGKTTVSVPKSKGRFDDDRGRDDRDRR